MKKIVLILFCFQVTFAFSQNYENPQPIITGYNIYGYINGIRLDSLPAVYATFSRRGDSYTFDYGQEWSKRKETIITDGKGIHSFLEVITCLLPLTSFIIMAGNWTRLIRFPMNLILY